MITRLIDWVAGREPVATATGLAGLITAALGVAAAFGLGITAEQIAAIGAFAAALAGYAARRVVSPVRSPAQRETNRRHQLSDPLDTVEGDGGRIRGSIPLALIISVALIVVLGAGLAVCGDALFEDEDEVNDLGAPALVLDHDGCWEGDCYDGGQNYEDQWSNEDRNRNRNRNRGAFSPGPFDDSPVDAFNGNVICLPGSTCYSDDRRDQPPDERGRT